MKRFYFLTPVLIGLLVTSGLIGIPVLCRDTQAQVYHASYRAGSIAVTGVDLTKAITFTQPMASTNYSIILCPSLAATISYTAKTTTGFTITIGIGVTGYIDWMAVPTQ